MSDDPRAAALARVARMEAAGGARQYAFVITGDRDDAIFIGEYLRWQELGTEEYVAREIARSGECHARSITERRDEIRQVAEATGRDPAVIVEILAAYFDLFGALEDYTEGRGKEFREAAAIG